MLILNGMTDVKWHLCAELDGELLISIGTWRGHVWYQLIHEGQALFASTEPELVHLVAEVMIEGGYDHDAMADKAVIAELYRVQSDMRDMRREAAQKAKQEYWEMIASLTQDAEPTGSLAGIAQYMRETGVTSYGEAVHQLYV
jgi:hypothetical protein